MLLGSYYFLIWLLYNVNLYIYISHYILLVSVSMERHEYT